MAAPAQEQAAKQAASQTSADLAPLPVGKVLPVRGRMLMPDGEPAAGAKFRLGVSFEGLDLGRVEWKDIVCDGKGRFRIDVPEWIAPRVRIDFLFRPAGAAGGFKAFLVQRPGPLVAGADGLYDLGDVTAQPRPASEQSAEQG